MQSFSIGKNSSLCGAFDIFTRPSLVKTELVRACLDGATQSKVSAPFSTPTNKSSGSPMPRKWRGLSAGSSSFTHFKISPRVCLSNAPPIPKPSKEVPAILICDKSFAAFLLKSSYCAPCSTPNNAWYGLSLRTLVNRSCSTKQRWAHNLVRSNAFS
ncbi:unannotated protein [freshwater metagenome]|uniref:Unannotated protein n=1 Tax=freshwater metagenome TaxID=449393 RepID=A0A6J6NM13_9ZZZZ